VSVAHRYSIGARGPAFCRRGRTVGKHEHDFGTKSQDLSNDRGENRPSFLVGVRAFRARPLCLPCERAFNLGPNSVVTMPRLRIPRPTETGGYTWPTSGQRWLKQRKSGLYAPGARRTPSKEMTTRKALTARSFAEKAVNLGQLAFGRSQVSLSSG
jgi:hypothetical protein